MAIFSPLADELRPTSDTSNTVSAIGELRLKSSVNLVPGGILLQEKSNDHSLLVLHPAGKPLNVRRRLRFNNCRSLEARTRMPNPGARRVHSIGL
jgi:hypothetical protein